MATQVDFDEIKQILIDHFEIDEADVQPDANLYEDLGLDSIDAVDLVIKLQEMTGKKIKPEQFKDVRTVEDVKHAMEKLLA
ncbi:acyl carrier protein [Natronospira bacteriovora]|uniref:Acyl carrier protein n=1 Tax=Natronospira bacteriovora TaxID=3069753 RepID=A0ABU0W7K3_9GAMM|nr:acyl carrier protein [Natronospira sp. AB-CW4]MDQ2069994.1 acyl carrier protein [Natronospira sp. AB-CW4]